MIKINRQRLIENFIALVKTNSTSGNEKDISNFLKSNLENLGGKVTFDSYGNLLSFFEGKGETIILNCHLDTVHPGENIRTIQKGDRLFSDGKTILGADAKAGLAIILEILNLRKEKKINCPPLQIILTKEEESGLIGARNLDFSLVKGKYGLVFDGDFGPDNITIYAPGYYFFECSVLGKAAHAGMEPEKGVSAILGAAKLINKIPFGRIDSETTQNIGIIQGGDGTNIISNKVIFKGEIRGRNKTKLLKQIKKLKFIIEKFLSENKNIKVKLNGQIIFDPYAFSLKNKFLKKIQLAYEPIGLKPKFLPSGGGTDANIFNNKGFNLFPIGFGAYNTHTTSEYLILSEMEKTLIFCINLLKIKRR